MDYSDMLQWAALAALALSQVWRFFRRPKALSVVIECAENGQIKPRVVRRA